jgi:hypothetical protein
VQWATGPAHCAVCTPDGDDDDDEVHFIHLFLHNSLILLILLISKIND